MAESEMDAQKDTTAEDTEKKSSTRRPVKKRSTKKATKKPVKKTRATKKDGDDQKTSRRPAKKRVSKKSEKNPTQSEASGEDDGRIVISRRPDKRPMSQDTSAQSEGVLQEEPKKEMIAQQELKDERVSENQTGDAVGKEQVSAESSDTSSSMQWGRKAKKSGPIGWEEKSLGDASRPKVRPIESVESKPPVPVAKVLEPASQPAPEPVSQSAPENYQAPQVVQEKPDEKPQEKPEEKPQEKPNVADVPEGTVQGTVEKQTVSVPETSPPTDVLPENPGTEARRDQIEQDNRRGRNNNRGGRNRGRRGRGRNDEVRNRNDNSERQGGGEPQNRQDENRGRHEEQRHRHEDHRGQEREARPVVEPSSSLMELLATSWTEEKTREFLNDGILARLSPGLVDGHGESIQDIDALKEPLKAIRRVLADECMVADDVADIMLLDVVMGALADRVEVCRLQASPQSLKDMDVLLDMRCKADKRLIEAVNALKNA
jgi:hypothetical protein